MTLLAVSATSSGSFINALTTISKFFGIAASIAIVGVLLSMGFLLEDEEGDLGLEALKLRTVALWSGGIWIIAAATNIILTLANFLDVPIGAAFDWTTIRSFVTQITLGQYMFFQLLVAILVVILIRRVRQVGGAIFLMMAALFGVVAPIFQSHSAASGSHGLAVGSPVIHVVALMLWVGGVFGLGLLQPHSRAMAVRRFSHVALWATIAVVLSGVANAWTRLNFATAWQTSYAVIVIAKVVLTLGLIFIGYQYRSSLNAGEVTSIGWAKFSKLIGIELSIMIVALALGSWLSTNQPPAPANETKYDAATFIAGLPMPKAPNLTRLVLSFEPDALFIGLVVLATALYLRGVYRLHRQGDYWSGIRTISFLVGMFLISYATSGGIGLYARFSFSYHMIAHMILGMIAPIFIVLSAPITLALRTLPQGRTPNERGVRGTFVVALHSRLVSFWVNPVAALMLFDGSLFALYFTSLFGGMMRSDIGHFAMNLHFVLAGLLFFHVIIGVDPNPKRVPHLMRMVILFAAMSIHAFFSVALMSSTSLLDRGYFAQLHRPWSADLLADQHLAGSIGWATGEIPILLALVATFIFWVRDDSREAKRIDRNAERLAAMGEPDELAHYNQYLAKLAQRDLKIESEERGD
ncbi:MAG: bifunctional copper resistance protein CopD/cytochrome c oxidase assembly protein [Actinobacteria bacterium]|nr:bifunctional copper resistance protein CopD/cytochrome c oxidase assembly protein [Actinomycetota bacterium]